MIKDLLSPSDVDANTMIALCSALHFKGSWEYPFDVPVEDDFHLSESAAVKTQMMQKKVESRGNRVNLKKKSSFDSLSTTRASLKLRSSSCLTLTALQWC